MPEIWKISYTFPSFSPVPSFFLSLYHPPLSFFIAPLLSAAYAPACQRFSPHFFHLFSSFLFYSPMSLSFSFYLSVSECRSLQFMWLCWSDSVKPCVMVFRLDGCSFDYAHSWSKSGFSICRRHLVTSKESSNRVFLPEKTHFPSCVRNVKWATI